MPLTVPAKVTCIITARRLGGVVQSSSANVIGLSHLITYDGKSLEDGFGLSFTAKLPFKRIVSTLGSPVNIEAASVGDECTLEVLQGDSRLYVRESIVFGACE